MFSAQEHDPPTLTRYLKQVTWIRGSPKSGLRGWPMDPLSLALSHGGFRLRDSFNFLASRRKELEQRDTIANKHRDRGTGLLIKNSPDEEVR